MHVMITWTICDVVGLKLFVWYSTSRESKPRLFFYSFSGESVMKFNFGLWDMQQQFSNGTALQTGWYGLAN